MKQKHIQENLPAFVLGELDAAKAEQIRSHLSECAECRRLAEQMQTILHTAEQLRAEPLDQSLTAPARRRLLEAIHRLPDSPSFFQRLQHPFLRYAAAAAIVAGAILALHILGPQTLPDRRTITVDTQQTAAADETTAALQNDLAQAASAFQKHDLQTLGRLLQSNHEPVRRAAADYLARIGDAAVLPRLDELARRWTGPGENPYQKAAESIRQRLADSPQP
jgi:anti-sigma factor RsiW